MEIDQILKHLEWLDDERRKDKDVLAKQEERILSLEGNLTAAHQQIKALGGEITRLSTVVGRMDSYDEILLQQRIEVNRQFEEMDKGTKRREEEMEKVRRVEMRALEGSLVDLRKELEPIAGLKRGLQARVEEETRLTRAIDEIRLKLQEMKRSEEEYSRTYRLVEDGRRQDSKRLVDMQGEVAALRKRADEQRGQAEMVSASLRKLDGRLSELYTVESERKEAQASFLDKQALLQVEYERTWKEWQARIETIDSQATEIETNLQSLDGTHRTVKRLQETTEELVQRIERRIGEITEIQRLSEERFRQDWVTFKADDQKRWTNYTITQEEQRSEILRNFEKITEQVAQLGDLLQEMEDEVNQATEQTEKRLQGLLALAHEWIAEYERVGGRAR
jgi:vacuolar-type H+-ATPase subunit I/STV1